MRRSARSIASAMVVIVVLVGGVGLLGEPGAGALGPSFSAHGSVNQVWVVHLSPGDAVELRDSGDAVVATGTADAQGAYLFHEVPAGSGYRVRQGSETSDPLVVTDPGDNPADSWYDSIVLGSGFGYLPTRDGTLLSINVTFPTGYVAGQRYPVLVDYSGYDPSQPGPAPSEAQAFVYQGYVVVGVNMRGTGCSGGAFDYFETLQGLDGYDAIEALAHQSWSNGDVGMVGISYPGISQLFVARTRPPHLRAITPLSVIADTVRSTLYPGGILNSGFALNWANERVAAAQPAARPWVQSRISGGDTVCAENQLVRLQSADLLSLIQPFRYYDPSFDALAPRTFVDQIDVPVYLAGQFQDEQTGGQFSTMVDDFAPDAKLKVTLTNGTHVEPLGPDQLVRLMEFVDFYVGKRIPHVNPLIRLLAPSIYNSLFGTSSVTLPPDRFDGYSSYPSALAAYEAEPEVRVLWENGAGAPLAGAPHASAVTTYSDWPPPQVVATPYYLAPDGQLTDTAPTLPDDEPRGVASYVYDPSTKAAGTFSGSSDAIWKYNAVLDWKPLSEGNALSFVTPPFATETAVAGMGSVDLWLRTQASDTDLEVTITEVRPDGQERYVQSGWLRASSRATTPASTDLQPVHSFLESDAAPMPAGQFSLARVALFPFAHVFRPGSRLRLNIEAPGGNQPSWSFTTGGVPGSTNDVAFSVGRPSKVMLPVLPSASDPAVPDALPPCPSLRNQPCRQYLPDRIPTAVELHDEGTSLAVGWAPPPRGGTPLSYRVTLQPSGDVVEVDGTTTTAQFDVHEPGVRYTASVEAVYDDGTAPASSPSLSVAVPAPPPEPTTTTTAPPAAPVGAAAAAPAGPSAQAAPASTSRSGLPVTGAAVGGLVALAVVLLVIGGAMTLSARSRRAGDR